MPIAIIAGLGTACGSPPVETTGPAPTTTPAPSATPVFPPTPTAVPQPAIAVDDVEIELPIIPPIALPDLSELSASGRLVEDQLGDLITSPLGGLDVVTATCENEGGALSYSGSSGNDIFEIDESGAGTFRSENEDGLVTLEVAADGSGEFYDDTDGLRTISVEPSGAGQYYRLDASDALTTVVTAADGSGTYYSWTGQSLTTVTVAEDGEGRLYDAATDARVTVLARPDGSGTFTLDVGRFTPDEDGFEPSQIDRSITLTRAPDGSWELTDETGEVSIAASVAADGSGSYVQSGRSYIDLRFDPEGRAGSTIVTLPEPPVFAVADRFPEIGKLGSLAPPCKTVLRFDSQFLFAYNSSDVRDDAFDTLAEVAAALNDADRAIEINGHTDSRGGDDYNLELSLDRATAVEAVLRQLGLQVDTVVNGFGESQPVAANENPDGSDNEAGRAQNRRVEIVIPD